MIAVTSFVFCRELDQQPGEGTLPRRSYAFATVKGPLPRPAHRLMGYWFVVVSGIDREQHCVDIDVIDPTGERQADVGRTFVKWPASDHKPAVELIIPLNQMPFTVSAFGMHQFVLRVDGDVLLTAGMVLMDHAEMFSGETA